VGGRCPNGSVLFSSLPLPRVHPVIAALAVAPLAPLLRATQGWRCLCSRLRRGAQRRRLFRRHRHNLRTGTLQPYPWAQCGQPKGTHPHTPTVLYVASLHFALCRRAPDALASELGSRPLRCVRAVGYGSASRGCMPGGAVGTAIHTHTRVWSFGPLGSVGLRFRVCVL